jgi:hypothetical protein
MTQEELIKQLETTCFGLDHIDPLRLLVDDVIAALAQPQRTWVGLTRMDLIKCGVLPFGMSYELCQAIEAKLKEKNNG